MSEKQSLCLWFSLDLLYDYGVWYLSCESFNIEFDNSFVQWFIQSQLAPSFYPSPLEWVWIYEFAQWDIQGVMQNSLNSDDV